MGHGKTVLHLSAAQLLKDKESVKERSGNLNIQVIKLRFLSAKNSTLSSWAHESITGGNLDKAGI